MFASSPSSDAQLHNYKPCSFDASPALSSFSFFLHLIFFNIPSHSFSLLPQVLYTPCVTSSRSPAPARFVPPTLPYLCFFLIPSLAPDVSPTLPYHFSPSLAASQYLLLLTLLTNSIHSRMYTLVVHQSSLTPCHRCLPVCLAYLLCVVRACVFVFLSV